MNLSITWIEEDLLAVGQLIQNQHDLNYLYDQGIRAVINLRLQNYADTINHDDVQLYHIPIVDMQTPEDDQVVEFLTTVQHHFSRDETVYVHCTAGCGRTGTMVAIWLYSLGQYSTPEAAIEYLRELRPCSVESKQQEEFVITYSNQYLT